MRCHPERSGAESKDPATLLEPDATRFLDFARNDAPFVMPPDETKPCLRLALITYFSFC